MCRAHLLLLHHCQKEPSFHPISQQGHYLRETHVCCMCRSIKSTSLRDASVDFGIPHVGQLFRTQIEDEWGLEVSGLLLGYDQNVLRDSVFIKLQNGLLYYRQPFQCPTSVERLGLDCKVEYMDANQGIMPESHNIWVPYTGSDLDNTFQGLVPSVPVLYFSWTPPHQNLQFQEHLPARNPYRPPLRGARRPNNGNYVLNLKNMLWWFQQSTKICMVGLVVLTGSSGLSNRLIRCILYLSEQLLDLHIWCGSILLHQIESIAYGL